MNTSTKNHLFSRQTILIGALLMVFSGCQDENSQLLDAIKDKNLGQVTLLIDEGSVNLNPETGPYSVEKPLAYAAAYGNVEIVRLLIDKGADLDGRVAYGDVPLIKAAEHNNNEIIACLIESGANVNAPNKFGVTPFIGLCGEGKLDLVKLAIKHGADVDTCFEMKTGKRKGELNVTPLQIAAYNGKADVVDLLLSEGADVTIKASNGKTAKELAFAQGHEDVVSKFPKQE